MECRLARLARLFPSLLVTSAQVAVVLSTKFGAVCRAAKGEGTRGMYGVICAGFIIAADRPAVVQMDR